MPSTSILMRSMEVIQTTIQGLNLTGLADANVLIHKVPRDIEKDLPATTPLPAVILAPTRPEELNALAGTNLHDQVVYGIQTTIIGKDDQSQTKDFDKYLTWREYIRRKFNNQRLAGVTEVISVTVQAGPIVNPELWKMGLYVSTQFLLVKSREARL